MGAEKIKNKKCDIKRGVRQDCQLSPRLFNIFANRIMEKGKIKGI